MRTEHLATRRPATGDSHHPTSTRLSDRAFYLIALALLLRKTAEPGPRPVGSQSPSGPQHYLEPVGQLVPVRG